ncbi:hypothetical protein K5L39_11500 [Mycolicibacter sp. MYC017]|uniref:Uncharacterized protein n=1 Tax=[Mycobacterium] vasticus TaxID=2875777 RepID=A0ABU5YYS0_9MYCO|nr:hypothetical protein [Mycolicibacter sp. MYC017]
MTGSEPPHDVWQLAERAVNLVPLTVAKMEELLATPLVEDPETPGRWDSETVRLSPDVTVAGASLGIDSNGWDFAGFDIESTSCITIDMVKEHYPSVELTYGVTGHSAYETFGWVVPYEWGELTFGIRVKDDCLIGISLTSTKELKHREDLRKEFRP